MKAQGVLVATSIKAMTDSVAAMGLWMPQVNASIDSVKSSVEAMSARVTVLEAEQASPDPVHTPVTDGEQRPQTAPPHIVGRGKRIFNNTAVQFDMGDPTFTREQSLASSSRAGHSNNRMPKTDFPKI
jgi:hypothetical protein